MVTLYIIVETSYPKVTCAREVFPVLVERHGHDPVRGVEGLLHAVPVVDVDVNVEDSLVVLQELEDGQHDVVDVAEAWGGGNSIGKVGLGSCLKNSLRFHFDFVPCLNYALLNKF